MGIFDIFKKKEPKKKEVKKPAKDKEDKSSFSPFAVAREVKVEKKPPKKVKKIKEKLPEKKEEIKAEVPRPREKIPGLAYRILKTPHVTEKATYLAGKNQYVFKIFPKTNKAEIKKAIEDLYGVDVLDVRIIKVPRKRRRLGRISGWRKGYKKAIVKIKKGQKIEVLPR